MSIDINGIQMNVKDNRLMIGIYIYIYFQSSMIIMMIKWMNYKSISIDITCHSSYIFLNYLVPSNPHTSLISYAFDKSISFDNWKQIYPTFVIIVEIDQYQYSNILRISTLSDKIYPCTSTFTVFPSSTVIFLSIF